MTPAPPVTSTRTGLALKAPEDEAGVLPAEAEAVLQDHTHAGPARALGHVVEVAVGVGVLVVDRGVDDAGLEGLHARDRLQRARRRQRVADHRLRRADRHLEGVLAQ